ncbi:MAG: SH3 domain-containing protein [Actinomycetota bacterium]
MKINLNHKLIASGSIGLMLASLSVMLPAKADTVNARCDVYPKGEDRATSSGPCTFSQRQGFVSIQLQNGKRYELRPVGNQPGNYQDQNGQPAYRQSGLGDRGQIYRLANQSIYVYWDTGSSNNNQSNQSTPGGSSTIPVTKMTRQNANQYTVQITEGEFNFSGVLKRTSGNTFIGSDGRVRVIYDRNTGRITIINVATGTEFYNYIYSEVNEGSL